MGFLQMILFKSDNLLKLSVKTYCSCQVGIDSLSVDSTRAQRWDPEVKPAARTRWKMNST